MTCTCCDKEFNEYEEVIYYDYGFYCHECANRELNYDN